MNETYLLQEIEKYKGIIAQGEAEKSQIDREIEETRRRMQEFRVRYRQHVCQQILAQKMAASGAAESRMPDNQSLPNITNYVDAESFARSEFLGGKDVPKVDRDLLGMLQESYRRDLEAYQQFKQREESEERPNEHSLPTDVSQFASQMHTSPAAQTPPLPILDDREVLKTREGEMPEDMEPINLVTIDSEESLGGDDLGKTAGFGPKTKLQPTKVTLNYSNTYVAETNAKTNQAPTISELRDNDLEIHLGEDSGQFRTYERCQSPLQFDTGVTQTVGETTDQKCQRFVDKFGMKQSEMNGTNNYQLVERTAEKKEASESSGQKSGPTERFRDLFASPESGEGMSEVGRSEHSSKSSYKRHVYGSGSKDGSQLKVSNIKISFEPADRQARLPEVFTGRTSQHSDAVSPPKNSGFEFIEKNKEVMGKLDAFFRKNKTRKENYEEKTSLYSQHSRGQSDLMLSGQTRNREEIFRGTGDAPPSEKRWNYRYPQD